MTNIIVLIFYDILAIKRLLMNIISIKCFIKKNNRQQQDSNLRRQSPTDFESVSLTTRTYWLTAYTCNVNIKIYTYLMIVWSVWITGIQITNLENFLSGPNFEILEEFSRSSSVNLILKYFPNQISIHFTITCPDLSKFAQFISNVLVSPTIDNLEP